MGYPEVTKTIAAFSTITKRWKEIGQLMYARDGHGVFIQHETFVVVGGKQIGYDSESGSGVHITSMSTERCTLVDNEVKCTGVEPILDYYFDYPEMIRVPYDYCTK